MFVFANIDVTVCVRPYFDRNHEFEFYESFNRAFASLLHVSRTRATILMLATAFVNSEGEKKIDDTFGWSAVPIGCRCIKRQLERIVLN